MLDLLCYKAHMEYEIHITKHAKTFSFQCPRYKTVELFTVRLKKYYYKVVIKSAQLTLLILT